MILLPPANKGLRTLYIFSTEIIPVTIISVTITILCYNSSVINLQTRRSIIIIETFDLPHLCNNDLMCVLIVAQPLWKVSMSKNTKTIWSIMNLKLFYKHLHEIWNMLSHIQPSLHYQSPHHRPSEGQSMWHILSWYLS